MMKLREFKFLPRSTEEARLLGIYEQCRKRKEKLFKPKDVQRIKDMFILQDSLLRVKRSAKGCHQGTITMLYVDIQHIPLLDFEFEVHSNVLVV
uniref:Uncharacterized protein n=1 Tax=Cucumis melo TaxID=3656 RepID=A0A9I9DNU6_CUCME